MDFQKVIKDINDDERYKKARIVALQLPEGLKRKSYEIIDAMKDKEIILLGDPFWGACDIPAQGKWDLLIQFGHSPIPNLGNFPKIMYIELQEKMEHDLDCSKVPFSSVTLTSNITYSNELKSIKEMLENCHKKVTLKKGDSRVFYPGQILGCNISAARGDDEAVLFIGEGIFHPLGISLALDKEVLAFNPRTNEYIDMEKEKRKFLTQRYAAIEKASKANKFGIIVSSKIGQTRYSLANIARKILEENGKKTYIISTDLIRDETLMNFPGEVYVNTACPRVTIEDYATFSRPIITFYELEMALNLKDKSKYILDEIVMTDEIGSTSFRGRDKSPGHN
jgi:2-(3-amino-3-carboxypropyl)histidine synthase